MRCAPSSSTRCRRGVAAGAITVTLLTACATSPRTGIAVQYARIHRAQAENDDGIGLGVYALASEADTAGWFVDVRYSQRGSTSGPRYRDPPPSSFGDPQTGREVTAISWHVGPTGRLTDWLHLYAGIGVGYWRETIEKFDFTSSLSADGRYRVRGDGAYVVSGSFGAVLQPWQGMLVGAGYDTFLEGPVFSLGFTF